MGNIFEDVERKQREENKKAKKEAVVNFTKDKFDKVKTVLGNKETYLSAEKEANKTMKTAYKGLSSLKTNDKKLFAGGKEVKVSAVKRFASSGSSELHAKGNFSDMKKRFGRFE